MTSHLEAILKDTRERVARAKHRVPVARFEEACASAGTVRDFEQALRGPGISVIAEFKRGSPSAGRIRADADPVEIARAYEAAGASAISVLTEPDHFSGSMEDLTAARRAAGIPVLRKDFIVDPYQLVESRAAGADAVLLILAALEKGSYSALHEEAKVRGLHVLVEIHDEEELESALEERPSMIGVNQRDLRTFEIHDGLAARLRPRIPADIVVVAESGITSASQMHQLVSAGIDAVLIGGSLMKAESPGDKLRELLDAANA